MLLRLAYLGITSAFTLLRLLPGGDRDKDIEILSLRHQLAVLQRQLDGQRVRFEPVDRAWLAALLRPLPRPTLRRLRLLVRPDTVLRWHRELIARRHALMSRPRRRGRPITPSTLHRIRATLRSALNAAIRDGLLRDNPARFIELPKPRRPHAQVWSDARVKAWQATGQRLAVACGVPVRGSAVADVARV
jgi:hypothetical protein